MSQAYPPRQYCHELRSVFLISTSATWNILQTRGWAQSMEYLTRISLRGGKLWDGSRPEREWKNRPTNEPTNQPTSRPAKLLDSMISHDSVQLAICFLSSNVIYAGIWDTKTLPVYQKEHWVLNQKRGHLALALWPARLSEALSMSLKLVFSSASSPVGAIHCEQRMR